MKTMSEYLAEAVKFDQLADGETNIDLKQALKTIAVDYRKLAAERAKKLGIPVPKNPRQS
jgi:hypothetical protein